MSELSLLHFIRPLWLAGIPLVWLLVWTIHSRLSADGDWERICDAHLLSWLVGGESARPRRRMELLLGAGLTLALLALSGPTWSQLPHQSLNARQARVVALDLSYSMLSEDVKPSRLRQAHFKLNDLLEQIEEGQVGLVGYSAQAFVVSPLTNDTHTIQNMIPALVPSVMPAAGSRTDRALEKSAELFRQAGVRRGEIILITDSAHPNTRETARNLAAEGFHVSVLGIGTPAGAPIPAGNGFLKDKAGNIVVTRLNSLQLKGVADAGKGIYQQATSDNRDLAVLLDTDVEEFDDETDALGDHWQDQGPWLALALLPMAALAFRRGWLLVALLFLMPVAPARAAGWADLWARQDQQAEKALRAGEAQEAANLALNPALSGEAHYRTGDYASSVHAFQQLDNADGHYNRGNALAQLGEYEHAIAAYDQALEQSPQMEDAEINKALVEQLLEQQRQEQQQQREGDESQEQSEQQDGDSSESSEQSESDEQQSDEGEESEESDQEGEQSGQEGEQQELSEEMLAERWSEEDEQAMEQWLNEYPMIRAGCCGVNSACNTNARERLRTRLKNGKTQQNFNITCLPAAASGAGGS